MPVWHFPSCPVSSKSTLLCPARQDLNSSYHRPSQPGPEPLVVHWSRLFVPGAMRDCLKSPDLPGPLEAGYDMPQPVRPGSSCTLQWPLPGAKRTNHRCCAALASGDPALHPR